MSLSADQELEHRDQGGTCLKGRGMTPREIAMALEAQYPRLKGLARASLARLSGRCPDQFTESPTVHAHELYLDMLGERRAFRDAEHLMAVASLRCVQIVVDYLRRRGRQKRGGGRRGVALMPDDVAIDGGDDGLKKWFECDGVGVALTRFTEEHPRQARVLMLKVCWERTIEEIGEVLGVSTSTVERDLRAARAYFRIVLDEGER